MTDAFPWIGPTRAFATLSPYVGPRLDSRMLRTTHGWVGARLYGFAGC